MLEQNKEKTVLIVGSSAVAHSLARWLCEVEKVGTVYVAPGNKATEGFAKCVDIREDDVDGLLEFAIKNNVSFTIVSSFNAIKSDIAGVFVANEQPIFAPEKSNADFLTAKSSTKKFLYRLRIPTPKFAVFDKPNLAVDYVKNNKMLLISSDVDSENFCGAIAPNTKQALTILSDMEFQGVNKFVIEDYIKGHNFTLYVVTDGVSALPLGVVGDYRFKENGDGGLYTLGSAAYSPDYNVSFDIVGDLMDNVIGKIIENTQNKPYVGIIGLDCVLLNNDDYIVTNLRPFMKDSDIQAVLNQLDTDFLRLLESCVNGSFTDEYSDIPIKDESSISCVLFSTKPMMPITGLDKTDDDTVVTHFATTRNPYMEYLTNSGRTLVVSQTAPTFTLAKERLYDNIEQINFQGKSYRRDIGAYNIL